MPVTTIYEDGTVTAFLSGDIDHHTAAAMRETIDQTVESSLPQKLIGRFQGRDLYGQQQASAL